MQWRSQFFPGMYGQLETGKDFSKSVSFGAHKPCKQGLPSSLSHENVRDLHLAQLLDPTSIFTLPTAMAEPQPRDIREGADPEDDNPAVPASAEERKTAAALSSLDARNDDEETPSQKTNVDQEALGKAMSQLGVNRGEKEKGKAKEAEVKKKVKVEAADVALLVGGESDAELGEG